MRAPAFWDANGGKVMPVLLSPFGALYAAATARRVARWGWRAPVPVICCGNAGAGGSGKTTLALDIGARLIALGRRPAFVSRGYGARVAAPRRVSPSDAAADVGDEPLLLAQCAAAWVCPDRAAAARAAIAAGANTLVMDDGLQNPGLDKTVSLLVIDGGAGFGNGRVIPAGPLREPVAAAASRCHAAVLIGEDRADAAARLGGLPILRAHLSPIVPPDALTRPLLAFAGIGRPEKFFATLRQAGADLAGTIGFADHHRYDRPDLLGLLARADRLGARPVTTPKDAVRIPADLRDRFTIIGVTLVWDEPAAIDALLRSATALP